MWNVPDKLICFLVSLRGGLGWCLRPLCMLEFFPWAMECAGAGELPRFICLLLVWNVQTLLF